MKFIILGSGSGQPYSPRSAPGGVQRFMASGQSYCRAAAGGTPRARRRARRHRAGRAGPFQGAGRGCAGGGGGLPGRRRPAGQGRDRRAGLPHAAQGRPPQPVRGGIRCGLAAPRQAHRRPGGCLRPLLLLPPATFASVIWTLATYCWGSCCSCSEPAA
jgi:hypothetical protein